ncbi:MAG: tripartite tricarboxylate transporter substrate binding protein [Betaproteobacteria bacterium]|jgi:tripartite-type tricarboxylate transporter receptor subunit TctC|nr:tripartite tricarboxylate transporter substrate binding protein [Betaproteobacteria bacterium]MDH4293869.1 tripartite tricarboxylate transporter substrate binding protein [Betaproteobacteria bacterium]
MNKLTLLAALALSLAPLQGTAQTYPTKPLRIIVPFAAGGPTDTHSRWAAQQITAALGQQVIVDNRGGAGGVIGTEAAARAAPDGYTLLGGNPGPLTIAPSVRKQLNYDTQRDFAPITLIAKSASCMCVHPSIPVKGLRDFVALAKRSPGKINYGAPGAGTVGHLGTELFSTSAGIKMNMIPYKGAALYLVDLMAGNIDFAYVQIAAAAPLVNVGKLRALAVTATERSPLLPDTATAAEQGINGFSSYNWNGLLAPANTPKAVIERLHGVLHKPLTDPAVRKQLTEQGYEVSGDGPAEYAVFIKSEIEKWARVAKAANIPKQ